MRRIIAAALTVPAALLLAACGSSTPTSTSPSTTISEEPQAFTTTSPTATTAAAPTTPIRSSWAGNGVFSVGEHASGGAKASIPAGRYEVELASGETFGYWVRCSALPCSLNSATRIDIGNAEGVGFSTVVDVEPTDGAVFLYGVKFVETN